MKHSRQGRSVKGDEDGRCENQLIGRAGARFGGDEEGKKLGEMSKGKRGDWGGLEEGEGQEQNEEKSGVSPVARREREEKKSDSDSDSDSELEERKLPEKNNDDREPRLGYECVV